MNASIQTALKQLRLSGMMQSLEVRLQEAAGNQTVTWDGGGADNLCAKRMVESFDVFVPDRRDLGAEEDPLEGSSEASA